MYSSGLSNVVREWIQTFHVIGSVLIHAILEYSNKGSLGTGTAHTRLHHNHPVTPPKSHSTNHHLHLHLPIKSTIEEARISGPLSDSEPYTSKQILRSYKCC